MAYGEKYCSLAEHLFMSYKLFGNCDYPFYVITDETTCERLKHTFDGVIVCTDFVKSTVDKLKFFTNNPFDESIFIDSDCSIVNDIKYVFDEFEKNGSPISAIADYKKIFNKDKGIQFGTNAIKEFNLTHDFPGFNGGLFYYKKCDESERFKDFMFNQLIANYNYYGMRVRENNGYEDEPPLIVSMLKFGFSTLPVLSDIMNIVHNGTKVKWDMNRKKSSFKWYEYEVHPTVIHWLFGGTETPLYEKYNAILFGRYHRLGIIKIYYLRAKVFIKYHIYPFLLRYIPSIRKIAIKFK